MRHCFGRWSAESWRFISNETLNTLVGEAGVIGSMAVDDAGSTWIKRKMSGAAEESPSKKKDLTKENHSNIQDGMVEAEERVVAEVEEENTEEGGDFGTSNGSRQTFVIIDADVLNCSICFEAFRPPIYQCRNGHAYCSPCCVSLCDKCPVCSRFIGVIRNLALERVVESVQISCINSKYGCNKTQSYLQRDTHHKICNYIPCTCPVPTCGFKGSSISLSDHFRSHHGNSAMKFRYGKCCFVQLSRTENQVRFLLGTDGRLFLLLNNYDTTRGSALSIICISSRDGKSNYEYLLSVGVTLRLKASVESTTEWDGVYSTNIFLFIPNGFNSSNSLCVRVNIKKCNSL